MTPNATLRSSYGDGDLLPVVEDLEDRCPICDGQGWVERKVPLGHPDFGELFPCRCREQAADDERLQRLQRYSGLPDEMLERMTFEKFLVQRPDVDIEGRTYLQAAHTAASTFASHPEGWLLITGTHGSGKTHLAVAVVERCIEMGFPSLFTFVPDLLDHLRAAFSPNSPVHYDSLFEQVKSVPLLVLDDLGAESSTPWAREKLYQIVVHRHNARLPTVITTYLTMAEIEAAHARLASRLLDATLVNWVPIGAPDYRNRGQRRAGPSRRGI